MFNIRGLFLLLNTILIASSAFLGVNAYDRFQDCQIQQIPTIASSHPILSEPTQPDIRPLVYYQSIIDRDLFNTKIKTRATQKPINPDTLPQTGLELKLWGTAIGDEKTSYAVIQDTKQIGKKRQHRLYQTGDLIRNAKLTKIYRDKVILQLDGKNEVLKLEQFRSRSYMRRQPIQARRSKRMRTKVVRRDAIKRAVNLAKRLPAKKQFRQHRRGIFLYRINRNPALKKLGLRNGDLITAINGRPVYSLNEISEIYSLIQSRRRFNVEIKRRGRPTTIRYFIR
jgi:general secretion pathway protein C